MLSLNKLFYNKCGFARNFRRIVNSSCKQSVSKMDLNAFQSINTTNFSTVLLSQDNLLISAASASIYGFNSTVVNIISVNSKHLNNFQNPVYFQNGNSSILKTNRPEDVQKSTRNSSSRRRKVKKTSKRNSVTEVQTQKHNDTCSRNAGEKAQVLSKNNNDRKSIPTVGVNFQKTIFQPTMPSLVIKRNCSTNVEINESSQTERGRSSKKSKAMKSEPVISSSPESQIKEIQYEESESVQKTLKLFGAPKNTFHNTYQVLAEELKEPLRAAPVYKLWKDKSTKSSMWYCTYHVKWPEEIKFVATDRTKQFASHKAALIGLTWLREHEKINEKGLPLLYDKNQVKILTKQTVPSIEFNRDSVKLMNEITDTYLNKMLPLIETGKEVVYENDDDVVVEDKHVISEADNINLNVKRQRYLSLDKYLAKEKVDLPIRAYKEEFINILKNNRIVIVKGEPGCGKSTRIPQYVLEDWAKEDGLLGYTGRIAVTQPRRIAAISLAERVASERDEMVGHIVGYQVRLNSRFRADTGRILYCTTGILLRHLQSDPNLSQFSHVIFDEAHERDVNTDLLMNLIKRALENNPMLKLIIMSATIDTDMFSEYYDGAPVLHIPGFTYPVQQRFLDTCKINVSKTLKMCEGDIPMVVHEDVVKVLEYIHKSKPEGAILCFLPGWEDINKIYRMIPVKQDIAVYCLHSRLQDSEQWKIFSRPPPGIRKIILATNIAETSVTIDDVVYVVDTGMQKEQRFDAEKGLNCIDCHWISKANAIQRKGRAGRCQPGECYHMYTKSKFDSFPEYSLPEIMRTSLSKIVLDCKVFSNNMNALEFMGKLPTPPAEDATVAAVNELTDLELLDAEENLTSLGRTLANFQLEPKLSKAMVNAVIFKCVTPVIDIVTLYSAETEFFTSGLINKEGVRQVKTRFCSNSDHLAMMRVFEKWLEFKEEMDTMRLKSFCDEANLIQHKMETIEKLRKIHFDYLYNGLYNSIPIADDFSDNDELVKAVLFSGTGNVVQHRHWDIVKGRLKTNVNVFLTRHNHKASISIESVNCKRRKYPTDYLLYINEVRSNIRKSTLIRDCSLIPEISVLLFTNKKLKIEELKDESVNTIDDGDDDQIQLVLENTNIKFICDRAQAQNVIDCKEAILAGYRYHIQNLTEDGEIDQDINEIWDNILSLLNDLLLKHSV